MISIQTVVSDEIAPPGSVVEIALDLEGIRILMQVLEILSRNEHGHAHLFSDEWGGEGQGELGEIEKKYGFATCHQVNITRVDGPAE